MPSTKSTQNYIFRMHNDEASDTTLECWAPSAKLDTNKIKTIRDTVNADSSKVATSVPSPFARMHLFDTAFKMAAENLSGKTIYHQLVSDCLDMMQLLFDGSEHVTYKVWNKAERLGKLNEKPKEHPHKLLAYSLDLFFQGKLANIAEVTLIYYKNILMGGTSPFTLFFTSPNWQHELRDGGHQIDAPRSRNGDIYFDSDYKALFERESDFFEFMYKFYLAYLAKMNEYCPGLADYIKANVEKHKKDFEIKSTTEWSVFRNNPGELEKSYDKVRVIAGSNTYLQVNGIQVFQLRQTDLLEEIETNSDFVINATVDRYKKELTSDRIPGKPNKPLVVVKGMNVAGVYLKDTPWISNTDIRRSSFMDAFGNPIPLSERILPGGSNVRYPFITTEDFLEDSLVEMPFRLNREKFFTGFTGDFKYLLPIKKNYFNFFRMEDLKKHLIITNSDTKIIVELKVPIRNRKGVSAISFHKEYEKGKDPRVECKAGMAIFPFYRVIDGDADLQKLNAYTILFADKNTAAGIDSLNFFQFENIINKQPLEVSISEPRTKKAITAGSKYYHIDKPFDLIELCLSEGNMKHKGLIIPEWMKRTVQSSQKKFTFGIDLGTSNTHISFTEEREARTPMPFEIGEKDLQVTLLNQPGDTPNIARKYRLGYDHFPDMDMLVNREFIPCIIGDSFGAEFSFPIRTATCEKSTFASEKANLFNNINIGFYIDHEADKPAEVKYRTNLKWLYENNTGDATNSPRIEAFMEGLLLLIRNKIILHEGDIRDTVICWLAPQSMRNDIREQLKERWISAFRKVFKGCCDGFRQEPISESLAPYFYFKCGPNDAFRNRAADCLNVDIGGGTIDVMYLNPKGKILGTKYLSTSFRFAANDIWGSGINAGKKDNGFILNYQKYIEKNKRPATLEDNILASFMKDNSFKSEDIISLLFKYDNSFLFSESVKRGNPELLFILFLHYSAIVYHFTQLLEANGLDAIPRYFSFTGKGSQYIKLMCSEDKLTEFTKLLLRSFTTLRVDPGFRVIVVDKPKETTADGSVLYMNIEDDTKIQSADIKEFVHYGNTNEHKVAFIKDYTSVKTVAGDAGFNRSVLENLQTFMDKFILVERNGVINEHTLAIVKFLMSYNIKDMEKYYQELTNGNCMQSGSMIYDSYESVIDKFAGMPNEKISESFFFFGLKDALYNLSKDIISQ